MYLILIVCFFVVFPVVSIVVERAVRRRRGETVDLVALIGRWYVFWVVGVRLLLAGLSQVFNPGFTAQTIFGIDDPRVYPFVSELGFANIAFGVLGVLSLVRRSWVVPAALAGAVFLGLDGIRHLAEGGPYTGDRLTAMVTDLLALVVLGGFLAVVAVRVRRGGELSAR